MPDSGDRGNDPSLIAMPTEALGHNQSGSMAMANIHCANNCFPLQKKNKRAGSMLSIFKTIFDAFTSNFMIH